MASKNNNDELVLPRPGTTQPTTVQTIPAPTEQSFTSVFGTLLPPAQYLQTPNGKAAYYQLPPPPSSSTTNTSTTAAPHPQQPDRVLVIHGVQTPALGMLPLLAALRPSFPTADIVLLDLWGHGLTDTPFLPHTEPLFHSLIDALLAHLNWPSVHLIGYSFGAVLTASYLLAGRPPAREGAVAVQSAALVAPAGLFRLKGSFTPEQQALLTGVPCPDERAAREFVVSWLEGGQLVVPGDWKERVARGEVVAEAVRDWEMREHKGHAATVVAVIRDAGVMDREDMFARVAASGVPHVAVLGSLDDLYTEEQVRGLGFKDVVVVPDAGHGVVRQRVPEVAAAIAEFWTKLSSI